MSKLSDRELRDLKIKWLICKEKLGTSSDTFGILLVICANYGVWGAAGPISAIRGVGGSLSTTPEKRPTTPPKSILEHIVQDIVSVSGNRYFINSLGGICHGYTHQAADPTLLSV